MAVLTVQPSLVQDLSQLEKLVSRSDEAGYNTKDDESAFLQLFESIWMRAPTAWKEKCKTKILTPPPKPPRDRLRIDLWKTDPITIPAHVRTELEKWKADPSSFFLFTVTTTPSADPFTQLARLLHSTFGGDPIIKGIRARIGCISICRLKASLGRRRLRSDTDAESEFIQRMNSECKLENLRDLVCNGERYDLLAEDLGGVGSMVCWPPDISEPKLLRIPLEGSNRTKALECLRTRGINDLTKDDIKLCYDAAREILSTIEKNVQSFFQQYCLPTSASNEDMARDSWRQDLSGHEPASKKRKRNMVDDSTRSPTSSNASEGLHSTPQEPSFERDLAALSADTAEVGCEKDSELEFLNRGTIDTWQVLPEACDSNNLPFDLSPEFMVTHCFDPSSEFLFLSQEPYLQLAGAEQQRDIT